jgi:hypothetical protein
MVEWVLFAYKQILEETRIIYLSTRFVIPAMPKIVPVMPNTVNVPTMPKNADVSAMSNKEYIYEDDSKLFYDSTVVSTSIMCTWK